MTFILAGDINAETIPGTVSIPTWVLIAAIVALFVVREWERKGWFSRFESATQAIRDLTTAVSKLADKNGG